MYTISQKRTVISLERDVGSKFEFISPPPMQEISESSTKQVVATLDRDGSNWRSSRDQRGSIDRRGSRDPRGSTDRRGSRDQRGSRDDWLTGDSRSSRYSSSNR